VPEEQFTTVPNMEEMSLVSGYLYEGCYMCFGLVWFPVIPVLWCREIALILSRLLELHCPGITQL
jgi:hypothetical protein